MRSTKINKEHLFFLFGLFFLSIFALSTFLENSLILAIPFLVLSIWVCAYNMRHGYYLLLFLIPFSIEYQVGKTLGTDLPDESLMWILTTLLGVIILFSPRIRAYLFGLKHPIILVLLTSTAWLCVSIFFSTDILISVKYLLSKLWYLSVFFILPIIYIRSEKDILLSLKILLLSCSLIITYTFIRQFQSDFSFSNASNIVYPFFRNHVNYSAMMACMLPIILLLYKRLLNKKIRIALIILFLLFIISLIFTYSRGAWLGLLCCVPFYFLLKRKLLPKFFIGLLACTLFGLVFLIQTKSYYLFKPSQEKTIFHNNFNEHLQATYDLTDMSFAERIYRWIAGVKMVSEKPITGYGPNTFYSNYKSHTNESFRTYVSGNPEKSGMHNYYLLQFSEQGIIGGALFLLLIFIVISQIQKLFLTVGHEERDVILCFGFIFLIIIVELCVNDLIETDKIGSLFYLCLAHLVILTTLKKENDVSEPKDWPTFKKD